LRLQANASIVQASYGIRRATTTSCVVARHGWRTPPSAAKRLRPTGPSSPTNMTIESPVVFVRETADEQNFVVLAILTGAK